MTFNYKYGLLFSIILIIEILIALYVHDQFVRPFLGDVLVVILLYAFLKTFLKVPPAQTAIAVLVFAVSVEIMQYFSLADRLGLSGNKFAAVIIGSTFDWLDLLAYVISFKIILYAEFKRITSRS
ncbi:DUF2809 domain-containing protein [Paracrocinitomix mangrovi]|uniref:ribosomal maturation YjgA family protein n=1 Tax=Paracrocinitomix mangrovi TaxID=2862509 RepID=UPI001C8EB87B|nr:DUF2809 domain-containing protein [Paracrocinitomix mangrovi]UKN03131.1 DUF2809 domain-containing protein [Paracrocinitomix mangrovi]